MKLIDIRSEDDLRVALDHSVLADYVYMYPPRQAYGPLDVVDAERATVASLAGDGRLNLYFHFPFCNQICSFCNLYTTSNSVQHYSDSYISCLLREIEGRADLIVGKDLSTIYLGGGTPSLLDPKHFAKVFEYIERQLGYLIADVPEVSLEVAPDTVSLKKLKDFFSLGISRINLGFQSMDSNELRLVGRTHGSELLRSTLRHAMSVGFKNVCVDLIYGLQGQTFESWRSSVDEVVSYRPETICAYALTLRTGTRFDRRRFTGDDGLEQYRKYDYAHDALTTAGYEQETHVRYVLPGRGGYLQKRNHWEQQNILGFGAGARSYLRDVDLRNGYSLRHRGRALTEYMEAVGNEQVPVTDGFMMDEDERRRRAVILGLNGLDITLYEARFGESPLKTFEREFCWLDQCGLIERVGSRVSLNRKGVRHRDLAVQAFVSEKVRSRTKAFAYDD